MNEIDYRKYNKIKIPKPSDVFETRFDLNFQDFINKNLLTAEGCDVIFPYSLSIDEDKCKEKITRLLNEAGWDVEFYTVINKFYGRDPMEEQEVALEYEHIKITEKKYDKI